MDRSLGRSRDPSLGRSRGRCPRTAVRIVERLQRADRPDAAREVLALAGTPDPSVSLAGLGADALQRRLWVTLAPDFETRLVPALCDHLVSLLGRPPGGRTDRGSDEPPDAIACAGALATAVRHLGLTRPAIATAARRTAHALAEAARASVADVQSAMERDDLPDLGALSLATLRIEAVRWVVEVLGDAAAGRALGGESRRLCRLALRQSTAVIGGFVERQDLLTLFDTVAVITQVDNLLTLTLRLLDATAAGEEERTAFVETADEEVLRGFALALTRLTALLLRIAGKAMAQLDSDGAVLESALRQIVLVHRFCTLLGHDGKPPELAALEETLRNGILRLTAGFERLVADDAESFAAGSERRRAALARLDILQEVLHRFPLPSRDSGDCAPSLP